MSDYAILQGDCLSLLCQMPSSCIHTCVTSPPYFGLRDYGVEGQIGLEETPDAYVSRLVNVFREVKRVLRDDGTLFLNLGDSYFSNNKPSTGGKTGARYNSLNAQRAVACGTSGKALEGYQDHGCLCGNLCDACRKAYQIGKSHNDALRGPTPTPSPSETTREHTESPSGHSPTSGSCFPETRTEASIPDSASCEVLAAEQLLASHQTKIDESSLQHRANYRQSDMTSVCLLCGKTLERDAPGCEHKTACTCGIDSPSGTSFRCTLNKPVSYLAYPHSAINSGSSQCLKPKDLIGIPWRVAFALQQDGWYLRQDIIWHKPNPMPESVRDRCTKAHEYIFLLSKSERYYFDSEAIKEPAKTSPATRDKAAEGYHADYPKGDRFSSGERIWGADGKKNKRSVWEVALRPYKGAHFATFPPDLIEPCVLAGCPVGGVVLDPFGGAGTTGVVAVKHGRKAILLELNPEYVNMAEDRIASLVSKA